MFYLLSTVYFLLVTVFYLVSIVYHLTHPFGPLLMQTMVLTDTGGDTLSDVSATFAPALLPLVGGARALLVLPNKNGLQGKEVDISPDSLNAAAQQLREASVWQLDVGSQVTTGLLAMECTLIFGTFASGT